MSHVGVERRSNRTTLPRDGVDDASYGVPCNACSGDWSSKDDCSTVDSSGRAEYSSSAATMPLSKVATVAPIHVPNSQSIARSKLDLRKIAETRNPRLQPLHDVHANALPYAHAHVDVRCDSRTGKVPVCSDHLALKKPSNLPRPGRREKIRPARYRPESSRKRHHTTYEAARHGNGTTRTPPQRRGGGWGVGERTGGGAPRPFEHFGA